MATQYVQDKQGNTFIAASQRSDGSWRKQRRVKDGYIPQEEVPAYETKAKKEKAANTGLPPGITPEIWEQMKAQQRNQRYGANVPGSRKDKTPQQPKNENVQQNSSTFDANGQQVNQSKPKKQKQKQAPKAASSANQLNVSQQNFNMVTNSVPEPVLQNNSNLKNSGDEWVTVTNKKGRKNKKNQLVDLQAENIIEDNENELIAPVTTNSIKGANASTGKGKSGKQRKQQQQQQHEQLTSEPNEKVKKDTSSNANRNVTGETVNSDPGVISADLAAAADGVQVDPAKKLRNLKKRLREIETLKTKDVSTLDKDQVEKLKRYKEIKKLVKQLEDTL